MSVISEVSMQESVSMFNGIYWQIAFWIAGACVIFFIFVFVISKIKESKREKSHGKKKKTDVII